jgi:hypothetical protein
MAAKWYPGVLLAIALAFPACKHMRSCVPESVSGQRSLIDLCDEPDAHAPVRAGLAREVMELAIQRTAGQHPPGARPYRFLALSGGGLYGSFGVGVLSGWTAT